MRVMMLSYMTTAEGVEHKPGDVAEFDDAEGQRLIDVGGARKLTEKDEEAIAAAKKAADEKAAADKEAAEAAAAADKATADKAAADKAAAEKAAAAAAAAAKAK